MNVIDQLKSHVSIRSFKPDHIPSEILEEILECGLRTSSSGNMQSWSVIVSTEIEQKKRLFKLHVEQQMILEAPVVLTFCADFHRMRRWLKLRGAKDGFDDLSGFLVASFDAMIAAQSVCVAAESKGLGICYMGTTLWCSKELIQEFSLPKGVIPVTAIVMGYPNETPSPRGRLPLSAIVHHHRYRHESDADILEIYKTREIEGWKRYEAVLGSELMNKLVSEGIDNLAKYYTSEYKYGKSRLSPFARDYLEALKKQDYWNF